MIVVAEEDLEVLDIWPRRGHLLFGPDARAADLQEAAALAQHRDTLAR